MFVFFIISFLLLFVFAIVCRIIISSDDEQNNNYTSNSTSINDTILEETVETTNTMREYKIAGVTHNNENGKNIQKEISKILREYVQSGFIDRSNMYLGYSSADIKDMDLEVSQYEDIPFKAKLEESTFDDKPCVKVYIQRADGETYTHVGYIQKRYDQIQEVINILHNYKDISLTLYIVGGKIKKCEIDYDDEYNEKFYIETINLDYGLRLLIKYK